MSIKKIKDTSIFQGWKEFEANGREYRAEDRGSGEWGIYVKKGSAYIYGGSVRIKGRASCEKILQEYEAGGRYEANYRRKA